MKFEDIKEVFLAIRDSKENPQLSEFPDFIFENGFIIHIVPNADEFIVLGSWFNYQSFSLNLIDTTIVF